MATEIPSLWPDDVKRSDVITPLMIMRKQAAELERLTKGILRAEAIVGHPREDSMLISLEVVAPLLGNERRGVAVLSHKINDPYPCEILNYPDRDGRFCSSDFELLNKLRTTLQHSATSVVQSLLARGNEATAEKNNT